MLHGTQVQRVMHFEGLSVNRPAWHGSLLDHVGNHIKILTTVFKIPFEQSLLLP